MFAVLVATHAVCLLGGFLAGFLVERNNHKQTEAALMKLRGAAKAQTPTIEVKPS